MLLMAKIFMAGTVVLALVVGLITIAMVAPWYVSLWMGLFIAAAIFITIHGE
jgi:hypothetical protein